MLLHVQSAGQPLLPILEAPLDLQPNLGGVCKLAEMRLTIS